MLVPDNYPRIIANRNKPMPKQTEALQEIAFLRAIKSPSLNYCKKHFLIVDEEFINTFYPQQSKLIMNMANAGLIASYKIKKKKYYQRDEIEGFVQRLGFPKN